MSDTVNGIPLPELEHLVNVLEDRGHQIGLGSAAVRQLRQALQRHAPVTREVSDRAVPSAPPENPAMFRAVFEHSPDATFLALPDGTTLAANPAACALLGRSEEELCRVGRAGITDPTDPRLAAALAERDRNGHVRAEVTFIHKDGTRFPAEVSSAVVPGDKPLAVVTLRDTSERQRVEEALRHSEERLKQAVGVAHLGIYEHDHRADEIYYSPVMREIVGFDAQEPVTLEGIIRRTLPEEREALAACVAQAHDPAGDGLYCIEHRVRHGDGSIRFVLAQSRTFFEGQGADRRPARTIGAAIDITERRLAEEQLRRREQELRTLVEAAPDIIERLDRQFRLVYLNPAFERFTGIPASAALGKTKAELGMPPALCALWDARLAEVFQIARPITFSFDYAAPQGPMHVEARLVPEMAADGSVESVLSIVRDMTRQRQAEIEMRKAKEGAESASKAKGHFLAVLSHELRNPLSPVLATAWMLREDPRFDADTREQLEVICRNAELEARLIDDLLDVTRIERGKVELHRRRADLRTIIQGAVEVCMPDIQARKLEFGVDAPDGPYWVDADAARLQQVFWNLLKNAVKFTPVGGCVGVRCRRVNSDEGRMMNDEEGRKTDALVPSSSLIAHPSSFVVVEVNDSGEGIDPAALGRIFNAFDQAERSITRQFGGLGLGLTISKAMVEMHGGSIAAQSPGRGQGATFTVRLPLLPAEIAAGGATPPGPQTPPLAPAQPLRILLVEDHGDTARIMERLLSAKGHEVRLAADVATALKLATVQPFDLMLSDLGLPDGSGLDLMRALRTKGLHLPAIALSGYGQENDIHQSHEAGFIAHLTKPVSLPRLDEAIAKVVPRGRSEVKLLC